MAQLTNQQIRELQDILCRIKNVEQFILSDQVAVCQKNSKLTDPDKYINRNGDEVTEMNKHIGSNLAYLYQSTERLQNFIETNSKK